VRRAARAAASAVAWRWGRSPPRCRSWSVKPCPCRATYPPAVTINAVTLPRLSLFDTDPAELAVDAIVIGVHQRDGADRAQDGELLVAAGCESVVAAFDGQLTATLELLGATGAVGEVTKLATFGAVTAPL